jgi:oligosaccharide repeat unit polymerase
MNIELNAFLLCSIFFIYFYEIVRLIIAYKKYKNFFIYIPEIFLMMPIFFIYVLNFIINFVENDLYFNIFLIGFYVLYVTIKISKYILRNISNKINSINKKYLKNSYFHLNLYANNILFFIAMLLFIVVFTKKGIPIFSSDPDLARAQLGMGYILWPAFSFANYSIWLDTIYLLSFPKKNKYLYFYILKIIIFAIFILFTGWRGQIIQMILGIIILISFHRKLSIKYITFFLIFILFLAFFGILRAYFSGKSLYGGAVDFKTFDLINMVYLSVLYLYFRFQEHFYNFIMTIDFTNSHGPLYFKGLLMDLTILLPGKGQGLDNFLRNHLKINDWVGGGGLPPTLFGSFYIEYKIVSVILLSFILGFLLTFLYVLTIRSKNIFLQPIYASTLIWALKSVFGSIGQNFLTYNLTMTFFILIYIFLYSSIKHILKIIKNGR